VGDAEADPGNQVSERKTVKQKPDLLVILVVAFGLGVVATLIIPMTSNESVAAPASALQAGVIPTK